METKRNKHFQHKAETQTAHGRILITLETILLNQTKHKKPCIITPRLQYPYSKIAQCVACTSIASFRAHIAELCG